MRRNRWLEAVRVHFRVELWSGEARRVHQGERIGIPQACGRAEGARGDRLHDGDAITRLTQRTHQGAGENSLADPRVGSGDENAASAQDRSGRRIDPGAIRTNPSMALAAGLPAAPQLAP